MYIHIVCIDAYMCMCVCAYVLMCLCAYACGMCITRVRVSAQLHQSRMKANLRTQILDFRGFDSSIS